MTDIIKSLSVDDFNKHLVGHLKPGLIKTLKDNNIDGARFLRLTDSTLKLFNFDLCDVIDIITLISDINAGTKVLSIDQDNTQEEVENTEVLHSPTISEDDDGDAVLRKYVTAQYLASLEEYELRNLRATCRNWKRMQDFGLPGTSQPTLASVPSAALISGEGKENIPPRKRTLPQQEGSRKSMRVQLAKPVQDVEFVLSGATSDNSSDEDENPNAAALDSASMYKLPATTTLKTSEDLNAQEPHLPTYDVEKVLLEDEKTKKFVSLLKEGFLFISKYRKLLLRTLMRHMCYVYVDHPTKVNTVMKEGLAKSFVTTFPQFQKTITVPKQNPWSHMVGHFQNIYKRILTQLPLSERPRKSKVLKKKKKVVVKDCTVNIKVLAITQPDRAHRGEILEGMRQSFSLRVAQRLQGASISEILETYPQFKTYCGEVIMLEFQLMHPKALDMCVSFLPLVEKIVKKFDDPRITTVSSDDAVKAFQLVALKLPRVVGRGTPPLPIEEEIIVTLQVGVDIEEWVAEKRSQHRGPIQPYLFGVRGAVCKDVLKYFLVLDSTVMELGRIPFIRAADWLFKSFVVFNVHYPKSWTPFFKFLQTCFYQVFIEASDDVSPTAQELYTELLSL